MSALKFIETDYKTENTQASECRGVNTTPTQDEAKQCALRRIRYTQQYQIGVGCNPAQKHIRFQSAWSNGKPDQRHEMKRTNEESSQEQERVCVCAGLHGTLLH